MQKTNKRLFEILAPFIEAQDDDSKEMPELDELLLDLVDFANKQREELLKWYKNADKMHGERFEASVRVLGFVLGLTRKEILDEIRNS